ncbi:FAD binding domain-containing protein [Durotheca rogersii]|uniref:FAD binding domain-containing protein n=1 Tax=Durotheca rogersii TaxID=419775 RepID=UPI00221F5F89|nr:FAD binding domain-containing protein [Durotheca rogersii]KAI5866536.1 FAD binding domain-containing protein [Durotheca rogersii]
MQETDVLIVGGGPTGVTLGLELAVQGISFRIIDKELRRSDKSRALAIQPRTLELLSRHGNVGEFVAQGNLSGGATFYLYGKKMADIDISGMAGNAEFPLILITSQCETEAFLDGCLAKHGCAVERGVEARSFVQDDKGVTVEVSNPGGSRDVIRAKYVVGADGAHSSVRRSSKGFTFQGAAYPQDFILCDAHIRNPKASWNRFSLCMGRGSLAFFPLQDGTCRVVVSRLYPKEDGNLTLQEFQGMLDQLLPGAGELYDPTWITEFHLHHRGVNSYRDGRLFVAGDAAHIHSPAGAQGMNTGIQDSINLGWKLAKVIRGERPSSFLDSYDSERRPIGQYLLETSDKMFTWGCSLNPLFVLFRNILFTWALPWFVSSPSRRAKIFKFISQFGVSYRKSFIVGTATNFSGPVRGGDRAPDSKIEIAGEERYFHDLLTAETHHLVLFSGVEAAAAAKEVFSKAEFLFKRHNPDRAKLHMILGDGADRHGASGYTDVRNRLHSEFGLPRPSYVYIRPDGYVEHIGPLPGLGTFLESLGCRESGLIS